MLSTLTKYDRKLLEQHQNDDCAFENSWAYLLQACRIWPHKYVTKNITAFLTKKNDGSAMVIVHSFQNSIIELQKLAHVLLHTHQLPVILKNIPVNQMNVFKELGFDEYHDDEKWADNCQFDDQTFPQRIISLNNLMTLEGSHYRDLRWELRDIDELIVAPYRINQYFGAIENLLKNQDDRLGGLAYDAHRLFLDMESDEHVTALTFLYKNTVVGFSLSDRISRQCAAYNALIFDHTVKNIATKITFKTAMMLQSQGYNFMNFQGSESKALDNWKLKFSPCKSLERMHLILRLNY